MASSRVSLVARVERRMDELSERMVSTFVERIPIYGHLPREQLAGEIVAICRENLRIFFRCVRQDRSPTDDELAEPRASAARRAEERIPLGSVLTAYHIGGRIGWTAMVEEAREDEEPELLRVAGLVIDYLETVTAAVASAYLEEQQHIFSEELDARRSLTEAALAHETQPARLSLLASRAGVQLADGYLALALAVSPSPDEEDSGVTGAVAARRKVRRMQAHLDGLAGEPVLALLDASGGTALLPATSDDGAHTSELVASLAKVADADIVAGVTWCAGASAAAAAGAEAGEVLRLALALDRPPGAYRLDDVLLEHAMSSPAETALRLARLLDPLEPRTELLETLEAWYEHDFDRRAAAGALHVHPNTLDYRLRRIRELTGIDPASARGLQLLGAALTVRRVSRQPS